MCYFKTRKCTSQNFTRKSWINEKKHQSCPFMGQIKDVERFVKLNFQLSFNNKYSLNLLATQDHFISLGGVPRFRVGKVEFPT